MHGTQSPSFWQKAAKPTLVVVILGALVLVTVAIGSVWRDMGESNLALVYYNVSRSDLPIVVTERGNLESQVETTIRCEVENVSYDRSGNYGTQIIFIVPNGSAVQEGDLLVELDSAAIRERLDQQVLAHERARSQHIQAQARHDNQIIQNETAEAKANLNVELADLNLQMYTDPENGDFKLAKDTIERNIDEARNDILSAQASLELAKTQRAGFEELFKLGYRGLSELDGAKFTFMKAQYTLGSSVNKLNSHLATLDQLETYQLEMQRLTLEGDVETAKRSLKQVLTDNESQIAQSEASKMEAERAEEKEHERLVKLETQLELCKIYAPHDGMVVYAREQSRYSSGTEVSEGATVRQRQQLITLPDLSQMQVKTQIHEAVLDQVKRGLPVTVRIDAFPNRSYDGIVDEVAVVPSSSYFTNIKTYECTVRIMEDVEQLKPGMTAVVEIHVDRMRDILSAPVQAIVQINKDTWCYVEDGNGVERRNIELGRSNDKFVHLISGVHDGERVVLNPMAIFNEESRDTGIAPENGASEAPEIPPEELARQEEQTKKAAQAKNAFDRRAGGGGPGGGGADGQRKGGQRLGGGGRQPGGQRPPGAPKAARTTAGD